MLESLHHLSLLISRFCTPLSAQQQCYAVMVALFILANIGIYRVTRGKEFLILGYSAALFFIPFVRFH